VQWDGEFRTRPNATWSRFIANQHFTVDPPGFVWDATINMGPLLPVRVCDGYIAGEASCSARLPRWPTRVDYDLAP
jgi:hypothetical protein